MSLAYIVCIDPYMYTRAGRAASIYMDMSARYLGVSDIDIHLTSKDSLIAPASGYQHPISVVLDVMLQPPFSSNISS